MATPESTSPYHRTAPEPAPGSITTIEELRSIQEKLSAGAATAEDKAKFAATPSEQIQRLALRGGL